MNKIIQDFNKGIITEQEAKDLLSQHIHFNDINAGTYNILESWLDGKLVTKGKHLLENDDPRLELFKNQLRNRTIERILYPEGRPDDE